MTLKRDQFRDIIADVPACMDMTTDDASGEAAISGGIAESGLEVNQDRACRKRYADQMDKALQGIMPNIHPACVEEGARDGRVDYSKGANISGIRQVADAML